jgi:hypothetical protein
MDLEEEKGKGDVVCAAVIIQITHLQLAWLLMRHLFPVFPQHLRNLLAVEPDAVVVINAANRAENIKIKYLYKK